MTFLLNGVCVDEMTLICHTSKARDTARRICLKLKDIIPRQQFLISVQGAIGGKIIARENIKPYRKDVTSKCVSELYAAFNCDHHITHSG